MCCSKAGNPFNTSVLPSPPASSPSPSPSWASPPELAPVQQPSGSSVFQSPPIVRGGINKTSKSMPWITVVGILAIAVLALVLCILLLRYCCKQRQVDDKVAKRHETYAYSGPRATLKDDNSLQKPNYHSERGKWYSYLVCLYFLMLFCFFFNFFGHLNDIFSDVGSEKRCSYEARC